MAQVTVTINGRDYRVACDDGQEDHLARLGAYVDDRIGELSAAVGQVGDARLLVMVSLMLADDLLDASPKPDGALAAPGADEALCANMEDLAGRIEDIAERLEQA
jgi:cell division protein ZapA